MQGAGRAGHVTAAASYTDSSAITELEHSDGWQQRLIDRSCCCIARQPVGKSREQATAGPLCRVGFTASSNASNQRGVNQEACVKQCSAGRSM
jgi:hypothetical protein